MCLALGTHARTRTRTLNVEQHPEWPPPLKALAVAFDSWPVCLLHVVEPLKIQKFSKIGNTAARSRGRFT